MTDPGRLPRLYLWLFASLYALQGVVVAYFFNFNQLYLKAAGIPEAQIGWVQVVATLPLIFKFLAGPLSDRYNLFGWGHRIPYIIIGLTVQSIGLVGLSLLDPGRHLGGFTALALFTVTGLALFDTCCDGMVVDATPPDDRARVQGTLVAARFVATAVCSWGFGHWLAPTGNGPVRVYGVLWTCAVLGVIPLVQALRLREPKRAADAEEFSWSALTVLLRPRSLVLLAFGALYSTVTYGVEINLSSYYFHLGFKADAIGEFAALRYIGRAVGAALLPWGTARLGRRGVLLVTVTLLSMATAGQVLIGGRISACYWGFLFGAANGWADALFCVLAMEASDPRLAASTYALFMAASNVSVIGGGLFSSAVAAVGDYRPVFLGAALLALASWPLTRPLARPSPKPEPLLDDGLA